jgi:ABC-type multidrug transport system ATPase subunit
MTEAPPLLELSDLTKSYGPVAVLRGVHLALREGELLLLLGPNGAGKTTTTRSLTTLARTARGVLNFRGEPVTDGNRIDLRRAIGYISHQTFLYAHLTAEENLRFFGRLYGVSGLEARIGSLLQQVGLPHAAGRLVGGFSRGMQQRLSLARVLLTDPTVLILDEPYAGLDPEGSATLTRLLAGLKDGRRALLLITHDLEDCVPIADRVAVLARGRIVWEGAAAGMDAEAIRRRYFEVTGEEGLR